MYQKEYLMSGSEGIFQFSIPRLYKFVSILNSTDNEIQLYDDTRPLASADLRDCLINVVAGQNITVPLRNDNALDYTIIYKSGGMINEKRLTIIFSSENLNINSTVPQAGADAVSIIGDSVGLARQAQLPSTLDGGALRVNVQNSPLEISDSQKGWASVQSYNVGSSNITISGTLAKYVVLSADPDNTEPIRYGTSTNRPFYLLPGQTVILNVTTVVCNVPSGNTQVMGGGLIQ